MIKPSTGRGRIAARLKCLVPVALLAPALACAYTGNQTPATLDVGNSNAFWNCPTSTPVPTPVPIPTRCTEQTPGPNGTPGPGLECTKPYPTATPVPTSTPYGRWMSPGDRGSSASFYAGQNIRIGGLKLTLTGYHTGPAIPNSAGLVAQVFTFDTTSEAGAVLTVDWRNQTFVREVESLSDGSSVAGNWQPTNAAAQAAGLPVSVLDSYDYKPGESRRVVIPIGTPAGHVHAFGFLPGVLGGQTRSGVGETAHIVWILPSPDPYCDDNTSGRPRQGDGGVTYGHSLPVTGGEQFGYFAGWPVPANGGYTITQPFGCTDYSGELSGYPCPHSKPWFHSGIDIANATGTLLLSTVWGTVTGVGISPGVDCSGLSGSKYPHTNLGWYIGIQVTDQQGRRGPYYVRYGHTMVNHERVAVGDHVVPGQIIGQMDSTGCSTGPHTHFMVQQGNTFIDPLNFIGPPRR